MGKESEGRRKRDSGRGEMGWDGERCCGAVGRWGVSEGTGRDSHGGCILWQVGDHALLGQLWEMLAGQSIIIRSFILAIIQKANDYQK